MTTHLKPTELRAFQVTRESIKSELPGWVRDARDQSTGFEITSKHGMWLVAWKYDKFEMTLHGYFDDYLVAPWLDQPDHIEVWTPEQYAARTGGCPYEECIAICDDQEPSNRRWINREETKKRIRQLAKEGGAHERFG